MMSQKPRGASAFPRRFEGFANSFGVSTMSDSSNDSQESPRLHAAECESKVVVEDSGVDAGGDPDPNDTKGGIEGAEPAAAGGSDAPTQEVSTDPPTAGSTVAVPKKKTATDAIKEMRDSVERLSGHIIRISEFTESCREESGYDKDKVQRKGASEILESFARVLDLVFGQVQAIQSGNRKPDPFILNLLENMKGELASHSIEVVCPQPGEEVDPAIMTTIGVEKCPFWRRPGRVAYLNKPGLVIIRDNELTSVIRKAEVQVYQKQTKEVAHV